VSTSTFLHCRKWRPSLTALNAESWKVLYAEQAIAQRELVVGITELERRKLTDARSMLKTLSRIALP